MVRLRQAVLVARELEPVVAALRGALGSASRSATPASAAFGLHNAVMALGDTFVEVVSPVRTRHRRRPPPRPPRRRRRLHGHVRLDDVQGARRRAAAAGVREVFAIDDAGHRRRPPAPRDVGGAIVALDRPEPPGSWRWGGPAWDGAVPAHGPGGVRGATVHALEPAAMAARWADVLGAALRDATTIALDDGGAVRFVVPADGRGEGLAGFDVEVGGGPGAPGAQHDLGGARFTVSGPPGHHT